MKKLAISFMVVCIAILMANCGNKNQQVPFDYGDSLDIANIDPTVYGVCGPGTSMNVVQIITDTGDTLSLSIANAQEKGMLFGGLQTGDRMAVVPNADMTEAEIVINQATLLGNWVMPNPIDGSDEVGVRIKEGGIAESIEQSSIIYKTWRLTRGKLEIVLVREGGSEDEEVYVYDLLKLTADSLIFKDAEDTFEYGRQKPKEEYGKDIVLEESSADDFKM